MAHDFTSLSDASLKEAIKLGILNRDSISPDYRRDLDERLDALQDELRTRKEAKRANRTKAR